MVEGVGEWGALLTSCTFILAPPQADLLQVHVDQDVAAGSAERLLCETMAALGFLTGDIIRQKKI